MTDTEFKGQIAVSNPGSITSLSPWAETGWDNDAPTKPAPNGAGWYETGWDTDTPTTCFGFFAILESEIV